MKPENLSAHMGRLLARYEHNPILRGLIQLIPFAPAVDTTLLVAINNIREERAREYFDELNKQNLDLTEDQIQNDDFLHAYFATTHAALNTRRKEKNSAFCKTFC